MTLEDEYKMYESLYREKSKELKEIKERLLTLESLVGQHYAHSQYGNYPNAYSELQKSLDELKNKE